MKRLKIVFMGTPAFATGILSAIVEANQHDVVAVITVADKPAGRGQKLLSSDVKSYALTQNLKIFQPTNLKDELFISQLTALQADVFVVVAFRMLPKVVWQIPLLGTFNLHASLLPQYRGAAPINWAIINGETETGVTTFFIDDKIDTGEIILTQSIEILPSENAGLLHDKLMLLGRKVVEDTLNLIKVGNVITVKQTNKDNLKTAYKLNAENCKINWQASPQEIINLIRGLSPYPGAWTIFKNDKEELRVKIFEAKLSHHIAKEDYFKVKPNQNYLEINLPNGIILIDEIQLPNKKRMKVKALLNGWQIENDYFIQ